MHSMIYTACSTAQACSSYLVHAAVQRQGGVAVLDERPHELVARLLHPAWRLTKPHLPYSLLECSYLAARSFCLFVARFLHAREAPEQVPSMLHLLLHHERHQQLQLLLVSTIYAALPSMLHLLLHLVVSELQSHRRGSLQPHTNQ